MYILGKGGARIRYKEKRKLIGIRYEKNITQKDMADYLGINPNSYMKKEKGITDFKLSEARAIANRFDKTMEDIFFKLIT